MIWLMILHLIPRNTAFQTCLLMVIVNAVLWPHRDHVLGKVIPFYLLTYATQLT